MDITTQKQYARAHALAKRDAIAAEAKESKSGEICRLLCETLDREIENNLIIGHSEPACSQGSTAASLLSCTKPFLVGVYAAFQNEVELGPFIDHAYKLGCRVAFPCMNRAEIDGLPMVMREVSSDAYARETVPFIASPIEAFEEDDACLSAYPIVSPKEISLLVIPMVAFDGSGTRLGYGGGNYDTYLPRLHGHTKVIGVAFAEQQLELVPFDRHDRKIETILSA